MEKLRMWISAARLRTLPLSISGILMGTAFASLENEFNWPVFLLALATTLGLQILSNFANDYGDGIKGTDNDERLGPQRAIQSGIISDRELKTGLYITSIITLGLAITLIAVVFESHELFYAFLFFVLGLLAIIAAITYTVGKNAYGYRGMGDLFVFLFFGLLSVLGSSFLFSKTLEADAFLLAFAIGFLSAAVLNLNNMRDRLSDRNSGKITLAVRLGEKRVKIYHFCLVFAALLSMLLFLWREGLTWHYLSLLPFVLLFIHLRKVVRVKHPKNFDPELKKVAISTFLIALLFLIISVLV